MSLNDFLYGLVGAIIVLIFSISIMEKVQQWGGKE